MLQLQHSASLRVKRITSSIRGISGPRTWGLRTSDLESTRTRLARHGRRVVLVCEELMLAWN